MGDGLVCSPVRHLCVPSPALVYPPQFQILPMGLQSSGPGEYVVNRARTGHPAEHVQGGPLASKESWQIAWCQPLGRTWSCAPHWMQQASGVSCLGLFLCLEGRTIL